MLPIWQKTKYTSKLRWWIFLSTFLLITEKMSIVKCFGHNNHPVKLISWMMNITFLCNLWILPTNNQSYHDHHICQNNVYIYICMLTYCGALIIKSKSSEEREKKTMNMMSVVYPLFQPILIRKMLPWTNSLCICGCSQFIRARWSTYLCCGQPLCSLLSILSLSITFSTFLFLEPWVK